MDLGIKGRRAIVTGGSSGIGFETARLFLDEGVRVLITGREMAKVNQARDALAKKNGGEVHAVVADMTKQADITRMVEFAKEKFGGVDILVNNAGTMYSGRFAAFADDGRRDEDAARNQAFRVHSSDSGRLSDDEGAKMGQDH